MPFPLPYDRAQPGTIGIEYEALENDTNVTKDTTNAGGGLIV